jgi:DNA repair photolyase
MVTAAALQINTQARYSAAIPQYATLSRDTARGIIARNDSPDLDFPHAINPYRGCEVGCVYCFARPAHTYLGFSPGSDFETRIVFKPEAASMLEKELSKPGYVCEPIVLGSNTDPYQPVERTLSLTRALLKVLERFNHPVCIVTKSALVLRDIDILTRMAASNLVRVYVSITTLDPALALAMEPRAASPARRLAVIAALTQAGVPSGVLATPMIPGLNDAELEQILAQSAAAGAASAGSLLLRLPHEIGQLFTDWLNEHIPDRAGHILGLIRQSRIGRVNDSSTSGGPQADLLARRFMRAAGQLGLDIGTPVLNTALFSAPRVEEKIVEQMALF